VKRWFVGETEIAFVSMKLPRRISAAKQDPDALAIGLSL
jgi:hypothetical protein